MALSAREARAAFADELTRLGVVLSDAPGMLRRHLEEQAEAMGVTRGYLYRSDYLNEALVRRWAYADARAATGQDRALLEARMRVRNERPESAGWPEVVRNCLVDHEAALARARSFAEATMHGALTVVERALMAFRYEDRDDVCARLGAADVALVATFQHRAAVDPKRPLVANAAWGRPKFEWAYDHVRSVYEKRIRSCDRLLWAWLDAATVLSAATRDQTALARIATGFDSDHVIVVAEVPRERLLATSQLRFDTYVLRGLYAPASIEDALEFVDRHGTVSLENADEPCTVEIYKSWGREVYRGELDHRDVRTQVCVDRIDPDEIIDVVDLADFVLPWAGPREVNDPDIKPMRLDT